MDETIDNYLNKFRIMKSMRFTQVSGHELVELAARGLDYSIKKKLDTQCLRDMAQLEDKEKIAYVEVDEIENLSDIVFTCKFGKQPLFSY